MSKRVVFCWGRFQPITCAHERIINDMIAYASSIDAEPRLYMSESFDDGKNPLEPIFKKVLALLTVGDRCNVILVKNFIQILKDMTDSGVEDVTLFCGQDRQADFERILNTYNGVDFNFKLVNVIGIPRSDDDISATKAREFVYRGKFLKFEELLPDALKRNWSRMVYDEIHARKRMHK